MTLHATTRLVGLSKIGHKVDGLGVELQSLVATRSAFVQTPQTQGGFAVEGVELQHGFELLNGFVSASHVAQGAGMTELVLLVFGIGFNQCLGVCQHFVPLPHGFEHLGTEQTG